ncbi:small conductance mechanosensitive channel [Ruminococcaceae bacterium FB2012]|nr:small conductance mechanosensitive channel [Ruminococcaceae bacterium FB2012]
MYEKFIKWIEDYGPTILSAALIFLIGLLLSKVLLKIISKTLKKSRIDPTGHAFLLSILRVAFLAIIFIVSLSKLGVPMTSIIAVLSAAGLAISLALKENLSNVASGFILMFVRPFKVGDYISTGGAEGTVSEITIIHTCLHTIDNKVVYIPNATVTSNTITNYTVEEKRRLEQHYSISYNADFEKACEAIRSVLRNDERFLSVPDAPMIVMDGHHDNSIGIMLRVWVDQENYWAVYFELFKRVKYAFDEAGISIPYNQLDVHLDNQVRQ